MANTTQRIVTVNVHTYAGEATKLSVIVWLDKLACNLADGTRVQVPVVASEPAYRSVNQLADSAFYGGKARVNIAQNSRNIIRQALLDLREANHA